MDYAGNKIKLGTSKPEQPPHPSIVSVKNKSGQLLAQSALSACDSKIDMINPSRDLESKITLKSNAQLEERIN